MTQDSTVRATTQATAQPLKNSPHVYEIFKSAASIKLGTGKNEFDVSEITGFLVAALPSTLKSITPSIASSVSVSFEAYTRYQYGRMRFVGSKKSATVKSLHEIIGTLERLSEQMDALVQDGLRDFFRGERLDTVRLELARDMHLYLVQWLNQKVGFSSAPAFREQIEDLISPLPQLDGWEPGFKAASNPHEYQLAVALQWLAALETGNKLMPQAKSGNKSDPNLALFIVDLAQIFVDVTGMTATAIDARNRRILRREFLIFLTASWGWLANHAVEGFKVHALAQPTSRTVLTIL